MKILLKILKGKSWMEGVGEKNEYLSHVISGIRKRIPYAFPCWKCHESCSSQRQWNLALSQGSLVFIINSYFQSNKGENSSGKNKEVSNPGSNISVQCCNEGQRRLCSFKSRSKHRQEEKAHALLPTECQIHSARSQPLFLSGGFFSLGLPNPASQSTFEKPHLLIMKHIFCTICCAQGFMGIISFHSTTILGGHAHLIPILQTR